MTRVLIVAERGAKIHVHRGAVVVATSEGRYTIPAADVDRIVLVTSTISITTAAIRRLAKMGIDILVLDALGNPVTTITPPWFTASSATRLAQYRAAADPATRLQVARSIIRAKILSQAALAEAAEQWMGAEPRGTANRLKRLAAEASRAESIERLRVIEAAAARRYWRLYSSLLPEDLGFHGRDPDAGDDVNTALNYLYGLLYSWTTRALAAHGLDPYIGFIHVDRSGAETLTYDQAELFRVAAVDTLLLCMLRSGWRPQRDPDTRLLTPETRTHLVREYTRWVREKRVRDAATGRRETIERHMMLQARLLARTLRSHNPGSYTPFTMEAEPPCTS